MIFLAILVAIPKAIILALGFLFRQKALLIVVIIVIGVVILFGQFNKYNSTTSMPSYQKIAPTVQQAPRAVQTSSRVYYVSTMKDDGEILTLTHYYFYDKKQWQEVDDPLYLDRQVFGEIRIYNRY